MAKKTAVKGASTKSKSMGNVAKLTKAGVIPAGYENFTAAEHKAIESLSATEVAAIISTKTKMGPDFFSKHASHGMYY